MKKILHIMLLCTISLNLVAQRYDNNWWIGKFSYYHSTQPEYGNMRVNFSTGIPQVAYDSTSMNFFVTNATISDPNTGRVLFYSNGISIYDSTNQMMLNGDRINYGFIWQQNTTMGYTLPQGMFVLPKPNSTTEYYLIHQLAERYLRPNNGGADYYIDKTYYSLIDMTLNNGKGKVVSKNQTIIDKKENPVVFSATPSCKWARLVGAHTKLSSRYFFSRTNHTLWHRRTFCTTNWHALYHRVRWWRWWLFYARRFALWLIRWRDGGSSFRF